MYIHIIYRFKLGSILVYDDHAMIHDLDPGRTPQSKAPEGDGNVLVASTCND